jgi:hypothetical protein
MKAVLHQLVRLARPLRFGACSVQDNDQSLAIMNS